MRTSRARVIRTMAAKGAAPEDTFVDWLCRRGDNCQVLGHRLSEWCGHSPVLEEDIALANTALDQIGQTQMWLGLAGEVAGKDRTADNLAYLRDAAQFRNVLLVEHPNGDFGQTLMRLFLFDAWAMEMLRAARLLRQARGRDRGQGGPP